MKIDSIIRAYHIVGKADSVCVLYCLLHIGPRNEQLAIVLGNYITEAHHRGNSPNLNKIAEHDTLENAAAE